jgi:hypothetical protein
VQSKYGAIRASSQRALIQFLHAELNIGATFLQSALLAHNDGHMEHYVQAKANSLKAIDAIKKFLLRVTDQRARKEMRDRLAELERLYSTI